jgi:probable F420-dependent oxidoreductase
VVANYPLGRIGLWTGGLEGLPREQLVVVAEIDEHGWTALWIPETLGREAFTHASLILHATRWITVATGIASIWGRDAITAAAGHRTLTEAFPERFVLGLGVSHHTLVEGARGHAYSKPYTAMKNYLAAMDAIPYRSVEPAAPLRRVIAALGPKMLALSAEQTDGAHPYLQTPEHTAAAREALGVGPVLAPEQMVVLEPDAEKARKIARRHLKTYLQAPNYQNNLRRLGFTDDDMADGGSDKLVDAIVAHGSEDDIGARVQEHRDAGADHVAVQPLPSSRDFPMEQIRRLAVALI